MFTPSRGKFSEKPRGLFSSQESLKYKRICKKCGKNMDLVKRTVTRLNFIIPIPGERHRFRCQKCYKEITIRSLDRLYLYIITGIFCIWVIYMIIPDFFTYVFSESSDNLERIWVLFSVSVCSLFPIIISISEIYKRIKYPILNEK